MKIYHKDKLSSIPSSSTFLLYLLVWSFLLDYFGKGVFNGVQSPSSLPFIVMNINTFELTGDGERLMAEV